MDESQLINHTWEGRIWQWDVGTPLGPVYTTEPWKVLATDMTGAALQCGARSSQNHGFKVSLRSSQIPRSSPSEQFIPALLSPAEDWKFIPWRGQNSLWTWECRHRWEYLHDKWVCGPSRDPSSPPQAVFFPSAPRILAVRLRPSKPETGDFFWGYLPSLWGKSYRLFLRLKPKATALPVTQLSEVMHYGKGHSRQAPASRPGLLISFGDPL